MMFCASDIAIADEIKENKVIVILKTVRFDYIDSAVLSKAVQK